MAVTPKTKILATFCKICPFCIAARKWPESAYARTLKRIERNCPCCKAYSKLKAKNSGFSET